MKAAFMKTLLLALVCCFACRAQFVNDLPYIPKLGNELQAAYWYRQAGTLNGALTAIVAAYGSTTNYSVRFNAGLYTLTSNAELPANYTPVFDAGAVVSGAYGLGLNRAIVAAEESQIFNSSVLVTNRSNAPMNARWFGFYPGATIGNASFLTAALSSSKYVYVPAVLNGETEYTLDGNVTIPNGVMLDVRPGAKIGLAGHTLTGGSRVRPAVHLMGGGSEDPASGAITGADNGKVDVYSYFTFGGGVFTNLLDAITQIDTDYPTTNRTLYFKTGQYPNMGAVTVPSRFQLEFDRGATIFGSNAFVFSNPVLADSYSHIFDVTCGLAPTNTSNAKMSACWFGATPDNNADDDATELIAMNAASRNFYIPKGHYYGTSAYYRSSPEGVRCFIQLLSNSSIHGDGPGQSVITMSVPYSDPVPTDIVHVGGVSEARTNILVYDLSLNGTNREPQTVAGATGGSRGFGTWGWQVEDLRVNNCEFASNTFSGCAVWLTPGGYDVGIATTNKGPVLLSDCVARLNRENGFNLNGPRFHAVNCVAEENGGGWECNSCFSTFANCSAINNWGIGFGLSAYDYTNTFWANNNTIVGGEYSYNGSHGISINHFESTTLVGVTANNNGQVKAVAYAGLYFFAAYRPSAVTVSGCTFLNNYGYGILLYTEGDEVFINGCTIGNGFDNTDTLWGIGAGSTVNASNNKFVGTLTYDYDFADSTAHNIRAFEDATYRLQGAAAMSEWSRSLVMGPGTLSGNGPDARFVSSAGGTNSTVTLKNLTSFISDAPITVATGHSYNVGSATGIAATIDVLNSGGTTNRLVYIGGIMVSNIANFYP